MGEVVAVIQARMGSSRLCLRGDGRDRRDRAAADLDTGERLWRLR